MLTAQKLEIAELEKQVAALQARVSELDTLLKATYGSHSWQITGPLRANRKLALSLKDAPCFRRICFADDVRGFGDRI